MNDEKKNGDGESKSGGLSDIAKRFLLTGLGAVFMTEESIRGALGDLKLPKEAVGFLFEQAKKQKEDLTTAIASEVSKFFSKVKLHEEIRKVLQTMDLQVEAKISFVPKKASTPASDTPERVSEQADPSVRPV